MSQTRNMYLQGHKMILLCAIITFCFIEITCECRHSYVTFCDDISDLKNEEVENWVDVVVGNDDADASKLRSVNFDSFMFDRFDKMVSFTVLKQISEIDSYTFAFDPYFNKVEYLKLYGNAIKRIKFTVFDSIKLQKLSLVNNSIEYFHKEAFYNCEIKSIDLSRNKLEAIDVGVFTEEFLGNGTKEIVFKYNNIKQIEADSLPESLEILNLDYNKLKTFNYNTFDNLINLQEFTLSHNELGSLPGIKNLKEIKVIDASYNKIVGIRAAEFNNLTYLEVIDLSHNQIYYATMFQNLNFPQRHPSLQISLAFNRFSHLIIQDTSFKDHIVFLYGNPWDCKCWTVLEKFMVDNKVKRNKCDLDFFGNGQVPYCYNYQSNDCSKATHKRRNSSIDNVDDFLKMISQSKNNVHCNLKPKRL